MSVEWDPPGDEAPESARSFGRRLPSRRDGAFAGLDARMIEMLEKLFEVPGVTGNETEKRPSAG